MASVAVALCRGRIGLSAPENTQQLFELQVPEGLRYTAAAALLDQCYKVSQLKLQYPGSLMGFAEPAPAGTNPASCVTIVVGGVPMVSSPQKWIALSAPCPDPSLPFATLLHSSTWASTWRATAASRRRRPST
jgi:hypothetical protein